MLYSPKFFYLVEIIRTINWVSSFPQKRESRILPVSYELWMPDQVRNDLRTLDSQVLWLSSNFHMKSFYREGKTVSRIPVGSNNILNIKYNHRLPPGRAAVYLDLMISYCFDFGFDDMTIRIKGIKINPDGEIVF